MAEDAVDVEAEMDVLDEGAAEEEPKGKDILQQSQHRLSLMIPKLPILLAGHAGRKDIAQTHAPMLSPFTSQAQLMRRKSS